jgi:hypothetical protein
MVNGTLQILASRHNLTIDARWTGYCREWTVKNQHGEQLFKSDDYNMLVQRLESGEGLTVGSHPPQGWTR